jgi:hypothetical protein
MKRTVKNPAIKQYYNGTFNEYVSSGEAERDFDERANRREARKAEIKKKATELAGSIVRNAKDAMEQVKQSLVAATEAAEAAREATRTAEVKKSAFDYSVVDLNSIDTSGIDGARFTVNLDFIAENFKKALDKIRKLSEETNNASTDASKAALEVATASRAIHKQVENLIALEIQIIKARTDSIKASASAEQYLTKRIWDPLVLEVTKIKEFIEKTNNETKNYDSTASSAASRAVTVSKAAIAEKDAIIVKVKAIKAQVDKKRDELTSKMSAADQAKEAKKVLLQTKRDELNTLLQVYNDNSHKLIQSEFEYRVHSAIADVCLKEKYTYCKPKQEILKVAVASRDKLRKVREADNKVIDDKITEFTRINQDELIDKISINDLRKQLKIDRDNESKYRAIIDGDEWYTQFVGNLHTAFTNSHQSLIFTWIWLNPNNNINQAIDNIVDFVNGKLGENILVTTQTAEGTKEEQAEQKELLAAQQQEHNDAEAAEEIIEEAEIETPSDKESSIWKKELTQIREFYKPYVESDKDVKVAKEKTKKPGMKAKEKAAAAAAVDSAIKAAWQRLSDETIRSINSAKLVEIQSINKLYQIAFDYKVAQLIPPICNRIITNPTHRESTCKLKENDLLEAEKAYTAAMAQKDVLFKKVDDNIKDLFALQARYNKNQYILETEKGDRGDLKKSFEKNLTSIVSPPPNGWINRLEKLIETAYVKARGYGILAPSDINPVIKETIHALLVNVPPLQWDSNPFESYDFKELMVPYTLRPTSRGGTRHRRATGTRVTLKRRM